MPVASGIGKIEDRRSKIEDRRSKIEEGFLPALGVTDFVTVTDGGTTDDSD